jgi:S-methylmethionine-dependent homocysteine/selenocysteine methylase
MTSCIQPKATGDMTTIEERLQENRVILLDGGVSTEIQRRGATMDANVWSGLTTKTHPDTVRQVHEDYIRAGAEVITANTYSTARHVLESIMLGHEAKPINFRSVQLAREARDAAATGEIWIAGSMSSMPPLTSDQEVALDARAEASYREQAEVLAESGVDLIIAEMMRDVENATMVVNAARATGLPVWVGFSTMTDEDGGSVRGLRWKNADGGHTAEDFAAIVDAIAPLGIQAAGIMHTRIGDIEPALEVLGRSWDGPRLAYAETGGFVPPEWHFEQACPASEYAETVKGWIAGHDLRIVGGCCGTGPEHIRALRAMLDA